MEQTEVVYTVAQERQLAQTVLGSVEVRRIYASRIALPISNMIVTYKLLGSRVITTEVDLEQLFNLINNTDITSFISIYWKGLEPSIRS